MEELLGTIRQLRPQGRAVILIEANGTTDVPALLEMLTISRATRHCAPPLQVAVVDALNWQHREWHNELEREQVAAATRMQISWQDHCDAARIVAVREGLKRLNGRAREVGVEELAGELAALASLSALGDLGADSLGRIDLLAEVSPAHSHDSSRYHFSALDLPLPTRVDRSELLECVAGLPREVIRMKGMACIDDDPEVGYLIQRAHPDGEPSILRMNALTNTAYSMVLIGAALDEAALRGHLRRCLQRYEGGAANEV